MKNHELKIKKHKKIVLYFIITPILITLVIWFYSYYKLNIYDETLLKVLIDSVFLPFYATLFWIVFLFFLEKDDSYFYKIYKTQLIFILICVFLLVLSKLMFIYFF